MNYKISIAASLCCFFVLNAHAQLANTQWKGVQDTCTARTSAVTGVFFTRVK